MNRNKKPSNRELLYVTVVYGLAMAFTTIFLYHYLERQALVSANTAYISTITAQISFMIMAQIHTLVLGNTKIVKLFFVGICCFLLGESLWQIVEITLNDSTSILQAAYATLTFSAQYSLLVVVSAGVQVLCVKSYERFVDRSV